MARTLSDCYPLQVAQPGASLLVMQLLTSLTALLLLLVYFRTAAPQQNELSDVRKYMQHLDRFDLSGILQICE